MPPKGKGKKGKKGKDVMTPAEMDKMSPEEMSEKQLKKYISYLKDELDKERKQRICFQLDTDKLHSFLSICRRDMEDTKLLISHVDVKAKEANKRQRFESGRYEVKVKHAEAEQHNKVSETRIDIAVSASLTRSLHSEAELALRGIIQSAREGQRYEDIMKDNNVMEVKMKQRMDIRELTKDYDQKVREMGDEFCKKYQKMIFTEEKKHGDQIKRLEEKWKSHAKELTKTHKKTLRVAGEKLSIAQTEALVKEKALEKRAAEIQKLLSQAEKDVCEAQQKNEHLCEDVHKAEQKFAELQQNIYDFNQAKGNIEKNKIRMKVVVNELRDVTVKNELLQHAYEKLQDDCNEMMRKHRAEIWDLQQQGALKEQILERRLTFLTQTV